MIATVEKQNILFYSFYVN